MIRHKWGLKEPLPTVCSQSSWIWEGGWGVQRGLHNLVTISEKLELQEDDFTELIAVLH